MGKSVIGLDIGGANLKAAHSSGTARLRQFALWKQPANLAAALRSLLEAMPRWDVLAVTMTGELCDCYTTRHEGVLAILDAVEAAAKSRPAWIWLNTGRFVPLTEARSCALQAAAANWFALAYLAGKSAPSGAALLIDIGSTTSDIVPLVAGRPVPYALTDDRRLRAGELVYTGVKRTPLCALLGPRVAAEVFATTLDAYLVLGELPEAAEENDTADGRPATNPYALGRLARMLCSDADCCPRSVLHRLARRARDRQEMILGAAIKKVAATLPSRLETVVTAGAGEFLANRVLDALAYPGSTRISLAETLGQEVSETACAHAVAVLAAEQILDG